MITNGLMQFLTDSHSWNQSVKIKIYLVNLNKRFYLTIAYECIIQFPEYAHDQSVMHSITFGSDPGRTPGI